jgi:arylsulfatase A-like enzyme
VLCPALRLDFLESILRDKSSANTADACYELLEEGFGLMNVIFISLDTFRADRIGALRNGRSLTPNLDKIAEAGARFTNAFANDIPTQPAHTAVMTGRYGISNGVLSHFAIAETLSDNVMWLPSVVRNSGYRTAAVDHLFLMRDWFARGYESYISPPGRSRSPAHVVTDLALKWIQDSLDGTPFFLFIHYWDPHVPYVPPKEFADRFVRQSSRRENPNALPMIQALPTYTVHKQTLYDHLGYIPSVEYIEDLYDAEVAYLDADLGRLVSFLEDIDFFKEGLLVVFGDHGENMAEHEAWFDHSGLYDSVVRVPMLIFAPAYVSAQSVHSFFQHIDIAPTVLELMGLRAPCPLDGISFVPELVGEPTRKREYIVMSEGTWAAKRAIRTADWKFIECYDSGPFAANGAELYDLRLDPAEHQNIINVNRSVADLLQTQMNSWVATQLGSRTDPMLSLLSRGLPGVQRLTKARANGHGVLS